MPLWSYFERPTNMAFHDLTTTKKPPKNLRSLLGLSLKFIPNPKYNIPWTTYENVTLPRFVHDFKIKAYIAGQQSEEDDDYNPRMYVRSNWNPPEHLFPFPRELPRRIEAFTQDLRRQVRRQRCKSNLLPHQRRALRYLRNQHDFLIIQCDKNLGPAIIERHDYIRMAFRDHLNDSNTYRQLSDSKAQQHAINIRQFLKRWLKKWHRVLTKDERRFLSTNLETNKTPFATFYITAKVHKTPLKSRPIVSCSGSLLHAIGVWIDDKLQHAAKTQHSYFKSSFDLKKILVDLDLPSNARLFTADAVSMYTNIPTDRALTFIGQYLRRKQFPQIPTEALMEALRYVMKNNIFTFGDTTWRQRTGTAMGTPPAPPWATLYFALSEDEFLPRFASCLFFYRQFIDDVLGIWLVPDLTSGPDQQWHQFTDALNNPKYGLTWDVSNLSHTVHFMDITISIQDHRIHTTLYEKPSNLNLYIPPHSCHPPGLLPGIVHGMILQFHTLCTNPDDIHQRTKHSFSNYFVVDINVDNFARSLQRQLNVHTPML